MSSACVSSNAAEGRRVGPRPAPRSSLPRHGAEWSRRARRGRRIRLGEATARELAARGARVTIADLNEERGEALAGEIGGSFARGGRDRRGARSQAAVEAAGALRLAVSCAGIGWAERTVKKDGPAALQPFETVVRVNLIGTFNVLRLSAAAMAGERARRGRRARRRRDDRLDRGLRRPDRPDRLLRLEGRRRGPHAARGARPRAARHPRLHDRAGPVRHPAARRACRRRRARRWARRCRIPPRLGRPEEYALLACHIAENPMLNGETIRLDGALRMPPK